LEVKKKRLQKKSWGNKDEEGEDRRTILVEYLGDSPQKEWSIEIEGLEKELAESVWLFKPKDDAWITTNELLAE
jgi:hypothetical protein